MYDASMIMGPPLAVQTENDNAVDKDNIDDNVGDGKITKIWMMKTLMMVTMIKRWTNALVILGETKALQWDSPEKEPAVTWNRSGKDSIMLLALY